MEKYQIKSEIDHILDRAGMYMGSINNIIEKLSLYQPSTNKIISVPNQLYNAGLQKIFDEILSNAVDEHRRDDSLFQINNIWVNVKTNGTIIIKDDGGIPVVNNKQTGILIPELIFGHLRTSSNYDDTQNRNVIGTNGLGAKLTNIFSTNFKVITADGKKQITVNWSENMKNCNISEITETKEHFTEIEFKIDLKRFDLDELNLSTIRAIQKRCIDACAVNPKLRVVFESDIAEGKLNSVWQFKQFEDYMKLYFDVFEEIQTYKSQKLKLWIIPQEFDENISFVNGALCSSPKGTHFKVINKQINDKILDYCVKNGMEHLKIADVQKAITIFVDCTVRNPTYDSQTKECLTNKLSTSDLKIQSKFLSELTQSSIIDKLKEFYDIRYAAEMKKEKNKLNKLLKNTKTKKLISSSGRGNNKELWLFEGTSASNGFRKYRNPMTQSAYLLRGKVKNTFNLDRNQIVENVELREILATLGLLFDEPQKNIRNLSFDKIIIGVDADYDGHHICGLLLAFFTRHFPELVKAGKIYRALSPIIICQNIKKKTKDYYYNLDEFEKVQSKYNSKDYEIRYTKGLGGLDDEDYEIMLRQQKLIQFNMRTKEDFEYVSIWFDKSTTRRKELLMEEN